MYLCFYRLNMTGCGQSEYGQSELVEDRSQSKIFNINSTSLNYNIFTMKNFEENKLDAMEDTSKYAAGREGEDISNDDADITPEERKLLDESFEDDEERNLHDAELDNRDDDGTLLNEKSSANSKTGGDLDVPGSGDDDADEDLGEEDEENNSYSLPDQEDGE